MTKYAILGDDIVIADRLVAVQYRKLIEELGLSISLKKTLLSESGTCEFAKPFILRSGGKGGNSQDNYRDREIEMRRTGPFSPWLRETGSDEGHQS